MHIKLGGFFFNLQSRLIPTARHFLKRQYWQRLRFKRITKHLPSRKQRYSICFWMLRRKKPLNRNSLKINVGNAKKKRNKNYLAALTRCYAVMVARRFVAANLARNKRFNGGRRRCGRCRTDAAGRRRCNGSRIKITRKVLF